MPSHTDDAIILTRFAFRERDWVVVALTKSTGVVRVLARRARGARTAGRMAVEPLTRVRLTYFERPRAEMGTLDEAVPVRSAFALASDPPRWAAGQVIAELAITYCQPGQAAEALFRLVDHCLEALLSGRDPQAVCHYAELWFVKLAGVLPEIDRCGACGETLPPGARVFDPREGTFCCNLHRPPRLITLSPAAVTWLTAALRQNLNEVLKPAPADVVTWLTSQRERFTDKPLKSWEYFQRLI